MRLEGLRLAQLGPGRAAAVCGRLFADCGAEVVAVEAAGDTPLAAEMSSDIRLSRMLALAGLFGVIQATPSRFSHFSQSRGMGGEASAGWGNDPTDWNGWTVSESGENRVCQPFSPLRGGSTEYVACLNAS